MRYWGVLFAKLLVAGVVLYGIWLGMNATYTPPVHLVRHRLPPFPHDLNWTTRLFLYNLLVQGTLVAIVIDQRYRCRTCGRRLRMPVPSGRYGQMLLLGRPKTEYICTYGHGTLKVPELHFSGIELNEWKRHEDMWSELFHEPPAKK